MSSIDEDSELHPRRPAVLEQGVDGGADGAAGEEHVVDEHDRLPFEREVELGSPDDRLWMKGRAAAANEHVVPVEGDVDRTDLDEHT